MNKGTIINALTVRSYKNMIKERTQGDHVNLTFIKKSTKCLTESNKYIAYNKYTLVRV